MSEPGLNATESAYEDMPMTERDRPEPELADSEGALVEKDLLVEDVSIDGMCGVY